MTTTTQENSHQLCLTCRGCWAKYAGKCNGLEIFDPKRCIIQQKANRTDPTLISYKATTCLLLRAGFLPHYTGFQYLIEAIRIVNKNQDILRGITKYLYPELARKFGTEPSRIERNIRHAIEKAAGSPGYQKIFGPFLSDVRPTNAHFLALAAEILRHGLAPEEVE